MQVDPLLPLYRAQTLAQVIDGQLWVGRFSAGLMRFITLVALGLSVIGLYGATARGIAQRTKEMAVRVAVGARPGHLQRLVLGRAFLQVALGLLGGALCTIAWEATFFGAGRVDARFASPEVIAPIALLLALVTDGACIVPARRAARLDPVVALREE